MAVLRLMTSSNLVGCMTGRSAGFSPLRIAAGIDAGLTIRIGNARSIAHQPAGRGKFAQRIDRGHRMARRQRDDLRTPAG